jgi:hypothetical protein
MHATLVRMYREKTCGAPVYRLRSVAKSDPAAGRRSERMDFDPVLDAGAARPPSHHTVRVLLHMALLVV